MGPKFQLRPGGPIFPNSKNIRIANVSFLRHQPIPKRLFLPFVYPQSESDAFGASFILSALPVVGGEAALTLHSDINLERIYDVCFVLTILAYESLHLAQGTFVNMLREFRNHLEGSKIIYLFSPYNLTKRKKMPRKTGQK